MTIREFADMMAGLEFECVTTRLDYIPKELRRRELPVSWYELPSVTVTPGGEYSTFCASDAQIVGMLYIAVDEKSEGFPADQRNAVLDMADEVMEWATKQPYQVEIITAATISVGAVEYRGVGARITASLIVS